MRHYLVSLSAFLAVSAIFTSALPIGIFGSPTYHAPKPSPKQAVSNVEADRELWIRDLNVVENPQHTTYTTDPALGQWTFGRLDV